MNIFPDRYRINDSNKRGPYNHPFSICTASRGKLVFLNWNSKISRSDLVQLRLHSPAENAVLERGIQTTGISLCYMNGIAPCFADKKESYFLTLKVSYTQILTTFSPVKIV